MIKRHLLSYYNFSSYLIDHLVNSNSFGTNGRGTTIRRLGGTPPPIDGKAIEVWKPSLHHPPYAYFDLKTYKTRLTWCANDEQILQTSPTPSTVPDVPPSHITPTNTHSSSEPSYDSTIPDTHSTTDHHHSNFLWNSMKHRRLLFLGDSVTRYQYLDLICF